MPLRREIFTVNQFLYDTEIISWDQRASAELRGKLYRCRFYLPALMPGINGLIHQTFNCLGRDLCYRYQLSECMYMTLIKYSASLNALRRQIQPAGRGQSHILSFFRRQIFTHIITWKKKKNHTWNHILHRFSLLKYVSVSVFQVCIKFYQPGSLRLSCVLKKCPSCCLHEKKKKFETPFLLALLARIASLLWELLWQPSFSSEGRFFHMW